MESIRIHEKNYDIVLFLDNNRFFGYKFNNDNTIEKIDKNVFKFFDFFMCSNNFTVLPNVDDYKVILDNETNFKHYFKGGSEDYQMFFLNNGTEAISYHQNKNIINRIRDISVLFIIGSTTVCLSLGAYYLLESKSNGLVGNYSNEVISEQQTTIDEQENEVIIAQVASSNITYDDIRSLIHNSNNLSKEEKEFLDNRELICDVLESINTSNITKYDLLNSFKNINISSYSDEMAGVDGYYMPSISNTIFVKNYDGLTSRTKDIIAHEQIHLLQYHYLEYNLLKETTAEIISNEYTKGLSVNAYQKQIILTKILMEIIGPKPIWDYTFTGDFSPVEREVKPYLSDDEYREFLDCIKYDYYNNVDNNSKIDKLNNLLGTLYKNKFNSDIENDQVIKLIESDNKTLRRYYFNKRYINKENSYYEDASQVTSLSMTLNEAVLKEYISVEEEIKEYIPSEQVYQFLKTHDNKGLKRHCMYVEGFKETNACYSDGELKISGYLEEKYYDNVSEDELIKEGIIIKSDYYYIKDTKKLTPKEYFNAEYNSDNKLNYYINRDKCYYVTLNKEGDLEVYFSLRKTLPTINDKSEINKVR